MMSTWCSKHVEAWNKLIAKQKFCASSWLITKISCIHVLRVRISANLEKEATVVWSCFWDPWIRRNRCGISRNSTYVLRDENDRKGEECLRTRNICTCYLLTLPLLVFSLLIVTRPTTESLTQTQGCMLRLLTVWHSQVFFYSSPYCWFI